MWERLAESGRSGWRDVLPHLVVSLVIVLVLVRMPHLYQHPEGVRPWIDADVKRVGLVFSAACCVWFLASFLIRVATVLHLPAPVYGRTGKGSVVLAAPWGVLGSSRDRLVVRPGVLRVRLEDSGPMRPFYSRDVQHIYFEQDGRRLHVVSDVDFGWSSGSQLLQWLAARGVSVELSGDRAVLGA